MEGVALLDMVVEHGGQKVIGSADGVEVAGEVEVDVLHGDHLGIAAAGGAALDAEHGAEGRLTQGHGHILADAPQTVGKADGRGGLALARGGGGNGGDKNELAVFPLGLFQQGRVDLGLVTAILLQILFIHMRPAGDFADGLHGAFLRDFNIGFVRHGRTSFYRFRLSESI